MGWLMGISLYRIVFASSVKLLPYIPRVLFPFYTEIMIGSPQVSGPSASVPDLADLWHTARKHISSDKLQFR